MKVRAVSYAWVSIGLAMAAWAIWGLIKTSQYAFTLRPWLIVLSASVLMIAAGVMFGRGARFGRPLVRLVSWLALLYSGAWLFLGGVDDALGYWPGIVVAVALAIYSIAVTRSARAA